MTDYKISILIPIYNRLLCTQNTLPNLFDSIHRVNNYENIFDVIVIDDGSTDGSSNWISTNYPTIHILKSIGDLWWSGAMNLGVDYALNKLKADYIVCWNNDIICCDNYFNKLINIINTPEEYFIGSIIYDNEIRSKIFSFGCGFNQFSGKKIRYYAEEIDHGALHPMIMADWTGGMGTIIHRCIFEKIGYWDAYNFPQYKGDSDFCLRAKEAGFHLHVYSSLKIWNDTTKSGLTHDLSWSKLYESFFCNKSNYNIKMEYLFIKRHGKFILSYYGMLKNYYYYIGGFIKKKFFKFINKENND